MKKICAFIAAIILLFSLIGCKSEELGPDEDNLTGAVEDPQDAQQSSQDGDATSTPTEDLLAEPPREEDEPQLTPEQEEAAFNLWHFRNLLPIFESVYISKDYPVYYPVEESTMNSLRDLLQEINEEDSPLIFDIYDIEPCVYGYRTTLIEPTDYLGNPYYIWFEVMPDDTSMPRNTLVATGPDGELSYQGAGVDYSGVGIGDDTIQFLTYDF